GHGGRSADFPSDTGQRFEFGLAFYVKEKHAAFETVVKLCIGLSHAGKDNFLTRAAGRESQIQLARACYIKASAVLRHESADAETAIRFQAIANERLDFGERPLQLSQTMDQRSLAVDVQRRAVGLCQDRDGRFLTMQNAIAVMETV